MDPERLKVLYIAGWGRSGSTIIGNILGQVPDMFHSGELWYMWERGLIENRLCGCGRPFRDCPTWGMILDRVAKDREPIPAKEMVSLHKTFARTRNIPALIRYSHSNVHRLPYLLQRYLAELKATYQAIQEATGCTTVVDSSKMPSFGLLTGMLEDIEMSILHLVRDPRATGFSWLRRKFDPGQDKYMRSNSLLKNSALWVVWNTMIERIWARKTGEASYLLVRYEDFVREPDKTIENIFSSLRVSTLDQTDLAAGKITLSPTHTVSGNPVRVHRGRIEIREDREWLNRMRSWQKFFVTTITWPLLGRYGYPLFP